MELGSGFRVIYGFIIVVAVVAVTVFFICYPSFGRLPRGKRLERIKGSPNYRNGCFRNQSFTPVMTSEKGVFYSLLDFVFGNKTGLRPVGPVPAVKTDLHVLDRSRDCVVWFGHSSYLIQTGGKRFVVDPVFCMASPVPFINRPFKGSAIYKPEDLPDLDFIVITHDHWDHLDYRTVMALKGRTGGIICPLGVGEHFEFWGFERERIIELDWYDMEDLADGFFIHCLPARHFSGRGVFRNKSLWASFLIETPFRKIYIGGDGGYGEHFKEIGNRFPDIDLAVFENGQYSVDWRFIHLMPQFLLRAVKDVGAKSVMTVHHSKYALAKHVWDEPLRNERVLAMDSSFRTIIPLIGEIVYLE